jgi:hypothetical protein
MVANVDLSFDAASWLNLRVLVGVDFYTTNGNNLLSQYSSSYQNSPLNSFAATNGIATGGIIDNYNDNNLLTNGSLFATVKKTFGDFRTTLALGAEIYDNRDQINGFYGEKFLQPDFNTINNTTPTTQRNSSNFFETRRIGQIARLGIVYKEMITINATGRQDYSSRLSGTANNTFFYPSFGAGFIFTELPGLKDNKVLSYGKLRFSYAGVGKDPYAPYKIKSSVIQQGTTGGGLLMMLPETTLTCVRKKITSWILVQSYNSSRAAWVPISAFTSTALPTRSLTRVLVMHQDISWSLLTAER